MHNHNNNMGSGHKGMWWMMIPCLLLVVITLFSGGKLASSNYFWLVIVGVCVVPHLWMMFKGGHGGPRRHSNTDTENKINNTEE